VTAVTAIVVGLVLIILSGAAESALVMTARSFARVSSRGPLATLADLLEEPLRTWLIVSGVSATGLLLVGAGLTLHIGSRAEPPAMAGAVAAGVLIFVLAYVAPRVLATRGLQPVAAVVAPILSVLRILFYPVTAIVERFAVALGGAGGEPPIAMATLRGDDARVLLEAGDNQGLLERDEREMIVNIFELGDTKVREVMVPRIDVVGIPIDATLDDALETILAAGHSRIPIYRESIDDIAGLLYAKDLLKAFRDRDFSPELGPFLREAYFVPESKPVDELLAELKTRKVHMAIVVDEYGGMAGLVTIEDLLEEIVGEIQDEYDVEESRIELVSESEGLFHAGVDIDDVNRLMAIELPTDDVDTLAGLVFTRLGKVPEPGEWAHFDDADIEVLAVAGRRIHRVRVVKHADEFDEEHLENYTEQPATG
jgi:putative hemolysin